MRRNTRNSASESTMHRSIAPGCGPTALGLNVYHADLYHIDPYQQFATGCASDHSLIGPGAGTGLASGTRAATEVRPESQRPTQNRRDRNRLDWKLALVCCLTSLAWFASSQPCWAQPAPEPAEQNTLVEVIVRDRVWPTLLAKASSTLESGNYYDAAKLLQQCFAATEDGFVLRTEWKHPAARGNAARLLRDAGEPAWQAYEKLYGIEAQQALESLEPSNSASAYHEVIRRYEHTAAGATALDRLASWHFGRGDYESAVACWSQLIANPVHASRVKVMQRLKLLSAAQRAGRDDIVKRESEAWGQARVSVGGTTLPAVDWWAKLKTVPVGSFPAIADWRMLGGSPERNRISTGSTPFLRPTATISMFDPGTRPANSLDDRTAIQDGRGLYERDIENAVSSGTAVGYAGTPIIKGNLILWRDVFGISAVDRQTRKSVWNQVTATPLHSLMSLNPDQESRRMPQPTFTRNSVLEQLTSDGQHVYLVDDNYVADRGQMQTLFNGGLDPNPRGDARTPAPWNRIVALRWQSSNVSDRQAWQVGGHPVQEPKAVLSGHYFLGPPVPLGGLLHVVTEYQRMISLVALQPENGRVVWKQPLSFVPQPSRDFQVPLDRRRLSQACLLAGAQGQLVCPLGSGIIVGLNQITGEITWIQDYRSRSRRPSFPYSPFSHNINEQIEEGEFPNAPLIQGDRVYFLAPGDSVISDQLYCFDLQTGNKHWQVECPDLKYLATVDDELLLGVGGAEVTGFAVQNGAVRWTRRVPRISGLGAALRGLYLLPVAEGRVLSLDPRDGSEVGFSMQVPGIRPGNLTVSGQDIISLNGLDLQVFPQSAELLANLEARPQNQRSSYNYWYELGELQFRLGQIKTAKLNLQKAVKMAEDSVTQSAIRNVLREVAWHELVLQPDTPELRGQILAEYAALSELPQHKAQYLLLQGEEQVRNGQLAEARQTANTLLAQGISQPLKLLHDPDRQLSAAVWVAELASREAAGTPAAEQVLPTQEPPADLLQKGDREGLMRVLRQHPNASWSPAIRLGLARLLVQDGKTQAAELLVWQDHLKDDLHGLEASRFLLELWEPNGLYEESGLLLNRMATRLASVRGADGLTGQDIYARYPRSSLVWPAAQRFVPLDWQVDNVRIVERNELDQRLRNTFNTAPRYLHLPQSSQQLVVRGHTLTNTLQQVDVETGSVVGNISLPPSSSSGFFQIFDMRNRTGHFLPLGGAASCYGISMLERGMAWNLGSSPQLPLNNLVRVGPCTAGICVFRSRDRLFALEPSTGQIMWERDDLEEGNRMNNALVAIPGDSEIVVLMEPDSKGYRLFKTSDGSFVRQGRLEDCVYVAQQFGRNLLYATEQDQRSIKLWDPAGDKVLFQAEKMAAPIGLNEREPEFTVADKQGTVKVVDGLSGRVKLDVHLNPLDFQGAQPAPLIRSFHDGTRYYVNVHRQLVPNSQNTYFSDAIFPSQPITGDLHAIDPQTSRVLWTRARSSQQNIVHLADYRLPFLVSLSRWRGGTFRANSQPSLRIDVIDGQTGRTLATKNNGFNDRLLLTDYDREAGRLRFRGAVTQFEVEFGRERNRPDSEQDEFVSRPHD